MEKENERLTRLASQSSPRKEGAVIQQPIVQVDAATGVQVDSLQASVKYLLQENTRLKQSYMMKASASLFHPNDPLMRRAHRAAFRLMQPENERDMGAIAKELSTLQKDAQLIFADVKVVDLNKSKLQELDQSVVKEALVAKVLERREKVKRMGEKFDFVVSCF